MQIYHISNLLIAVWGVIFCIRYPSRKKNTIFVAVSFTQLFVIALLRFGVGNDYFMYVEGLIKMGIDGFSNLNYLDWEPGFVIFTKIVAMFTQDERVYLAICAIACLIPPAILIAKYSKNVYISVLLYVNLLFFYCTLNFVRQSIAIAILTFSWKFIVSRKPLHFILIVLTASLVHISSLIILPLYFLVKLEPRLKTVTLYCYALLLLFITSDGVINLLTEVFNSGYKDSIFIKEGISLAYTTIPIVLIVLSLIFRRELISIGKHNRYLINILVFSTFFMVAMSKHAIMERFSYFSYIFVILLVPELLEAVRMRVFNTRYDAMMLTQRLRFALTEPDNAVINSIKCKANRAAKFTYFAGVATVIAASAIFHLLALQNGAHGVLPYKSWIIPM